MCTPAVARLWLDALSMSWYFKPFGLHVDISDGGFGVNNVGDAMSDGVCSGGSDEDPYHITFPHALANLPLSSFSNHITRSYAGCRNSGTPVT